MHRYGPARRRSEAPRGAIGRHSWGLVRVATCSRGNALPSAALVDRFVTSIWEDDQRQCLELVVSGMHLTQFGELVLSHSAPYLLQFVQVCDAVLSLLREPQPYPNRDPW